MALGIMLVLTIALTTVITFTASGARDSKRVNAGQKATALAEAGLSNALAVLNQSYPCVNCFPGVATLLPSRTTTYTTGTATWSGTLEPCRRRLRLELRVEADLSRQRHQPDRAYGVPGSPNRARDRPDHHSRHHRDRRQQPPELHLRKTRPHVPPVGGGRLAGLRGERSPPRELVDDQRVHRQRSRLAEPGRGRGSDVRRAEREQDRTCAAERQRQTGSARSTSSAGATPRRTTTMRRRTRAGTATSSRSPSPRSTRSGARSPGTSFHRASSSTSRR